jgi:hypothetical protein
VTTPPGEPQDVPNGLTTQERDLLAYELEDAAYALRDGRAVVRQSHHSRDYDEPSQLDVSMSWWEETDD